MKNSNDTIGKQTLGLPAWSAVPQPTWPPRAPMSQGLRFRNLPNAAASPANTALPGHSLQSMPLTQLLHSLQSMPLTQLLHSLQSMPLTQLLHFQQTIIKQRGNQLQKVRARSALCKNITQRRVLISNRRFGTSPIFMGEVVPKRQ